MLNQGKTYTVNGGAWESVVHQRDLGVQVHGSLKVVSHVESVVKTAFAKLAFIGRRW